MADINVKDTIAAEREVGRKYAILMRDAFKKHISDLHKKSGKLFRVGYNVRIRNFELQSISVKTVNYAFINYYGVDKTRKEHTLHTKSGKTVIRKSHPFRLNPKINDLQIPESIVNGFADEISEVRGDRVLAETSKILLRKD